MNRRQISRIVTIGSLIAICALASANTQWKITDTAHDLLVGSNLVVNASTTTAGLTNSSRSFNTGVITDSSTGTQDNFAPTGFATTTILRETPASALTIDGFASPANGRYLIVINASAATVTFANEAAGSTAANRIRGQNNASMMLDGNATNPNTAALLWYDNNTARWRIVATNQATWSALVSAGGGATISSGSLTLSGASTHLKAIASSTTPTLSSCGTSPVLTTGSTDVAGKVTTGSAATTCTITFGSTYTNAPACFVKNITAGSPASPTWTVSATAITMSVDLASHAYAYGCVSIGNGGT